MITCTQAIQEEFKDKDQILTAEQIVDQIQKKYPGKWKEITIRTHLIGCSINHKSTKWYPTFQKFLYTVEPGKVRLFNPEEDGNFKQLPNSLKVQFVSVESNPIEEKVPGFNFSAQRDLRKYLRRDIARLDPGLKIFNEEGFDISIEAIKNNILATDSEGNLVVVAIEGETATIRVLGQILNSMTSLKNELGERSIRGIIVAKDFDNEIVPAIRKTRRVSLVKYKVQYDFEVIG
jgi:endonuclease